MKFDVSYQESFSRGKLLLRSFFGFLYIALPHYFLLLFISLWGAILAFIAWWAILFTGKYPEGFFQFQAKLLSWSNRVQASLFNLSDEYPSFGLSGESETVKLDISYPESLSRGKLLLRTFFGIFYVYIPHGFCLYFRLIASAVLAFLAWWAVLFTGSYPERWFRFNVGTLRWANRLSLYAGNMTDDYPPFSGKDEGAE